MRRLIAALCLGTSAVVARDARILAQTPAASTVIHTSTATAVVGRTGHCTYQDCALRLEPEFWSSQLLRGAAGTPVGGFGLFHSPAIDSLVLLPDSAGIYARRYVANRRTSNVYSALAVALLYGSTLHSHGGRRADGWDLGALGLGFGFALPSAHYRSNSERDLSRSNWWYNSSLPR